MTCARIVKPTLSIKVDTKSALTPTDPLKSLLCARWPKSDPLGTVSPELGWRKRKLALGGLCNSRILGKRGALSPISSSEEMLAEGTSGETGLGETCLLLYSRPAHAKLLLQCDLVIFKLNRIFHELS